MNKTILYLDQNFASNLAKAENLPDWKDSDREFYLELLEVLRSRTHDDRLICPTSPFHREESEQGARDKEFIWHVVEGLSFGLSLRDFLQISFSQIVTAARAYCHLPEPDVPSWKIAFNRNPHESVKPLAKPHRVLVHLPSANELVEYTRKSKSLVADTYAQFKQSRKAKSQRYYEELEFQKKQLVYEIFCPPPSIRIGPPGMDQFFNLLGGASVIQHQRSILDILKHCSNPGLFFSSAELMEIPFIHTRASLMAADIYFFPDKKPSASLNTDFDMIASALPYVDILATDGYMSELINEAKLSERFGTKVFSMKQRRKLMEALRNLRY